MERPYFKAGKLSISAKRSHRAELMQKRESIGGENELVFEKEPVYNFQHVLKKYRFSFKNTYWITGFSVFPMAFSMETHNCTSSFRNFRYWILV